MATEILCPICGATYNLSEAQLGKKVRCKKCEHAFVAGGKPRAKDKDGEDEGIQDERRRVPPKARRDRGRDGEEEAPRRTPGLDKQARRRVDEPRLPMTTFLIAGVGVALLLLLCGGGGWVVYALMNSGGGGGGSGVIAFNLGGLSGWQPANLDGAVEGLRSNDASHRAGAAGWLAKAPVDAGRQAEVAKALDPLLRDADDGVKFAAFSAAKNWGTEENVPALADFVKADADNVHAIHHHQALVDAMDALARIKDPRGAEALAAYLPAFWHAGEALNALKAFGPKAAPAVVKYAFDPRNDAVNRVRDLLRIYGTGGDLLLDQALTELKQGDAGRRQAAAKWLAEARPDEKRRAEVSRALAPLIVEKNGEAIKAAKVWGTAENAPDLVDFLKANLGNVHALHIRGTLDDAMDALARLKDERGAEVVAAYLADGNGEHAPVALRAFGRAAQPAVLKYAFHPDGGVQTKARSLLRGYGAGEDVVLAQALVEMGGDDTKRREAAARWLAMAPVIESRRPEVARAINGLLQDGTHETCLAGLALVKTWGTRDNVPDLVRLVKDTTFNVWANDRRHKAMAALGVLKDERGVWPVAQYIGDVHNQGPAADALREMGPVVGKALMAHLEDPDPADRDRAWTLLGDFGTKASLDALRAAAAKEPNPRIKVKANAVLKAISMRP
jgi:predicted Zn finger-like uncharacterized protein